MQFLEGGGSGPNGRERPTVRSSEQDPADADQAPEQGSLMSRYRGTPPPAAEDLTPPPRTGGGPALPAPGLGTPASAGAVGDSPWRQSRWTSAPPVPPAPPVPAIPPTPPATPSAAPLSSAPSSSAPSSSAPSSSAPAASAPAASAPSSSALAPEKPARDKAATEEPADELAGKSGEKPAPGDAPGAEKPAAKPADAAPAATAAAAADRPTPAPTAAARGLLSAERSAEFRRRWRDLQADFVDDPQQAVRGAGDLSRQILQALAGTIADAERVDRWKAEDGTSGTEDLRVALRQYRILVDRLLDL